MSTPSTAAALHLLIQGRVQGVGFRYFALETAQHLNLVGWVRNLSNGTVETFAQGPKHQLEEFIERLKKGPPFSRVDNVVVQWQDTIHPHKTFEIHS